MHSVDGDTTFSTYFPCWMSNCNNSTMLSYSPADVPHRLVGDRLLDTGSTHPAGEWIDAGLLPSPVVAQSFQQLGRQRNIAIAQALAPLDMDDHALAVNVAHLQQRCIG